jgi:MYXO-CTERM domain-containing protein
MRFVQFPVKPVLLAIALATSAHAAFGQTAADVSSPVVTTDLYPLAGNVFAKAPLLSTTSDAASLTFTKIVSIAGFDTSVGVLVGVSGELAANGDTVANTGMRLGFPEQNVAGITSTGSLSTAWTIGSGATATTLNSSLISVSGAKDSTNNFGQEWNAPTTTAMVNGATPADLARLDQFVGASLNTTIVTTLGLTSNNADDLKSVAMTGVESEGVVSTQVDMSLSFSYLEHARVGLASDPLIKLGDSISTVGIDVYNQIGVAASAVSFDFAGESAIECADVTPGACGHFRFSLDKPSFADVLEGEQVQLGKIGLLGELGNHEAHYTLTFWDHDGTGAALSRRSSTVDFAVTSTASVSAVPEPHGAALLLAGLGAIGWMSRRRKSAQAQVAKL